MAAVNAKNSRYTVLDQRMVTDLSSAVAITWAPGDTRCVQIDVEDQPIRVWENGTAPTASSGRLLNPGDSFTTYVWDFSKVKMIQTTASAKVSVSCMTD